MINPALAGLIEKWLKAGILDTTGMVIHPVTGTPQGGIVSPILANVYLYYVLDLWFEKVVKPRCKGEVYLCRYADDFVVLFQSEREANWFYQELPKRLEKFGLELSPEKSHILSFSKYRIDENNRFDFLGLEYHWGYDRKHQPCIKRRTSRQKLYKSMVAVNQWCRENRFLPVWKLFKQLNVKLRGYYNYFGVIGNYDSLQLFFYQLERTLFKWLNRRSQRRSYNWNKYNKLTKKYRLLRPRITERRNYQLKLAF